MPNDQRTTLIIARSLAEATHYARYELKLKRRHWQFVSHKNDLYKYGKPDKLRIIYYGYWWHREDAKVLQEQVRLFQNLGAEVDRQP